MYTLVKIVVMSFVGCSPLLLASLPDFLKNPVIQGEQLFVDAREEKTKQLKDLQAQSTEFDRIHEEVVKKTDADIAAFTHVLANTETMIKSSPDDLFLPNIAAHLREIILGLTEMLQVRESIRSLTRDLVAYLQDYLDDPQFSVYKKEQNFEEKLSYSFEDLMRVYNSSAMQENLISQLIEQEKAIYGEKSSRKSISQTVVEDHTKMKQQLEELLVASVAQGNVGDKKRFEEASRYIEQLFSIKKELEVLRKLEIQRKLLFVQTKLFVERLRLDQLKKLFRLVKTSIRITEIDLAYEKELLAQEKLRYLANKEQYQVERNRFSLEQKEREAELVRLSKEREVPLGKDLDEWTREPRQAPLAYVSWAEVGALSMYNLLLKREIDRYQILIKLEEDKFLVKSVQARAEETYYKVTGRKFFSEEEVAQELEAYRSQKNEFVTTITQQKEQVTTVADQLGQLKKIAEALKNWQEVIAEIKEVFFKDKQAEYTVVVESLAKASDYLQKRIDLMGQITGIHSSIMAEATNAVRLIDFVISELQSITIWNRPDYAITWQGVKNIRYDIATFLMDMRNYIVRFTGEQYSSYLATAFNGHLAWFLFFLKCLALLLAFFLIYRYSGYASLFLIKASKRQQGMLQFLTMSGALWFEFLLQHIFLLSFWITLLFLVYQFSPDNYWYIFFFIFSIPYLLYAIYRFMRTLVRFNYTHDHALLSVEFQRRFVLLVSALLFATTIIVLFRQAFILNHYYRSELPTILLAINFIIFQISLIFFISKEQILRVIPTRNMVWYWVRDVVDNYFYLILIVAIAIIIMSNPYIGFGKLVLYVVSNFIYTVLLLKLFIWFHGQVKRFASHVFFYTGEDIVRERFSYARTWFGLLIIISFLVFTALGFVLSAKIWGWQIGLRDFVDVFTKPILLEHTTTPLSIASLMQIIFFVMGGFVVAYAINRFVLDKIFDLLLVDPGVQHATVRLIQYFLVLIAITIGFRSVGLGDLIIWVIGAALLGIGWNIREPLGDFIAYFIILIQRPIKIGDYIKMEEESQGVVQRITARSVIIRRKNSTTIVVPNSQIIGRSVINWNYVRNFIAFDDINVFIDYREDPDAVREILYQVVSSHPQILRNPKPIIRLDAFEELGYRFMVRGFISSVYTLEMWNIASDVRLGIMRALRANNMRIALPVRIISDSRYPKEKVQEPMADQAFKE